MAVTVVRTSVVKNLDEFFWHAIGDATGDESGTQFSIVTARAVTQRVFFTAAAVLARTILAARGAGHTAGADKGYAVALTAMRSAAVMTLDGKTFTFAQGDPPGTALTSVDDVAIDLGVTPTVATATAGDNLAVVEQPPSTYSWANNGIPYITAVGFELPELDRDIRDKGQLQHRKRMSVENGVATFSAKYENAKAGLSRFVGRDFMMIGEREDNRSGVVTEKIILYGARINNIPAPNESEGDTDSDVSIPVNFELMAIVGQSAAA